MLTTCIFLVFVGLHHGLGAVDDFDHTIPYFELIYHGDHELLLAIHGNECYYVRVPHNEEHTLDGGPGSQWHHTHLDNTENSLMWHIRNHDSVSASTLATVRDKYGDMLADYHCLDKNIFELSLFSEAQGQHGPGFYCLGKGDGLHAIPGQCHQYIVCSNHQTNVLDCPAGTVFSQQADQCTWPYLVPGGDSC